MFSLLSIDRFVDQCNKVKHSLVLALTCCVLPLMASAETLTAHKQTPLNTRLNEVSGIARLGGKVWGINDSGGEASIYPLIGDENASAWLETGGSDKPSNIDSISIGGAVNNDWESLAQDDEFLYIADTGNNIALRQRLTIYKVPLGDISVHLQQGQVETTKHTPLNTTRLQSLTFNYQDREDNWPHKKHNFDSEALVVVENELWLFTKNRKDYQTKLYKLNKSSSHQQVLPVARYPVKGLITGADYNAATQELLLLGYSKKNRFGHSFLWRVKVKDKKLDWQSAVLFQISPPAQWESVLWSGPRRFLLAAEKSRLGAARIAEFIMP